MLLVKNLAFFHPFFFGNKGQENGFYDIVERKNPFLGCKNKKFEKWENSPFFKEVSLWFWSKIGHFSFFFFKADIGQENVFLIFYNEKTCFLATKQELQKVEKLSFFQRG